MTDIWNIHSLSSETLELQCLPGIGGRLWDVKFEGQSLLFQNADLIGTAVDLDALADLPTRSPQFGFPLWGGEKTWISPDSDWPNGAPYPMLDSGPYSANLIGATRIRMQSLVCPLSHLQIEREIFLTAANGFALRHKVTNLGPEDRFTGNWSVLMLDRPCKIALETGTENTITPVFGDVTDMVHHSGRYSVFECGKPQEFKSGTRNMAGRVVMRVATPAGPVILSAATPRPTQNDSYAHGHDFEVFNSKDYAYCEAEWHSPARVLKPNESLLYHQDFTVRREADILSDPNTTLRDLELLSCMS
ncbi:hypothetical protein [Shimia abyssi]|uniref:Galactose mutarotase-like enzyme n=1 Tax=Shimia abyssi TaxID=1662395 RepID=A0A2P8F0W4_9RHOB|nr:hypothetical protein [Shimia abyssi]PSL15362.1 hypothetical protein CLV88_1257 [Shimia abyssi]